MKKYQILNQIGSGNFSTVFKGKLLPSEATCAIKIVHKHLKMAAWEANLLQKFKHPNIISILDFEQRGTQSRIILEYVGINTLELYESHRSGLKEHQVKCIMFQVALGLQSVHKKRIIHRDIKPQNILIDKKLATVKIIDFGLSIQEQKISTDYIATRWYRAPQNLLKTKEYTCAIDVFSLACVIVELLTGSPLFPGSNNLDQIHKIFALLGPPTQERWPKGYQKLQQYQIIFDPNPRKRINSLSEIIRSPMLTNLLQKMLEINPKKRISCREILQHEYFSEIKSIIPSNVFARFQEQVLRVSSGKPLNFKGFNNVRSSRMTQKKNQITHFGHQRINMPIIPSPSIVLLPRKQKSMSLDSIYLNYYPLPKLPEPILNRSLQSWRNFQNSQRKNSFPIPYHQNIQTVPNEDNENQMKINMPLKEVKQIQMRYPHLNIEGTKGQRHSVINQGLRSDRLLAKDSLSHQNYNSTTSSTYQHFQIQKKPLVLSPSQRDKALHFENRQEQRKFTQNPSISQRKLTITTEKHALRASPSSLWLPINRKANPLPQNWKNNSGSILSLNKEWTQQIYPASKLVQSPRANHGDWTDRIQPMKSGFHQFYSSGGLQNKY